MKDLLNKIQENNLLLKVVDGKLKVFTNGADIDKNLIEEIKARKEELTEIILENGSLDNSNSVKNTIHKTPELNGYPLSSSQQRLWTLSQVDRASISYNMPSIYELTGEFSFEVLNQSFKNLIYRHEILRTVFKEDKLGNVKQYVKNVEEINFSLVEIDFRGINAYKEKLETYLEKECALLFNLEEGPLLRGVVIRLSNERWIFCFVMHHIISDGWSIDVMMNELIMLYKLIGENRADSKKELEIQYKDYAVWQQDQLANGHLEKDKAYWLEHLKGDLPTLSHFGDFPRPAIKTYNGGTVERKIDAALYEQFKTFYKANEGTLFMGCLSLLNAVLHKYTGQEEFIIGSPVSGRNNTVLHDQIGFYVNTLALRTAFTSGDSFEALFGKVKENTLNAFEHQDYPFDELLDDLNVKRDLSRNALFDVMLVVQDSKEKLIADILEGTSLSISPYKNEQHFGSKFDLLFSFAEVSDSLSVVIEYNSDIFSKSLCEQLLLHMEQLLEGIVASPKKELSEISCLNALEKHELLVDCNTTETAYEEGISLLGLFKEQVALVPDKTALIYGEISLTYSELDGLSSQFSHYLEKHSELALEDLIAIALPKSHWQIISILGILKAGCAYVPIALDYPQERIDFIVSDTKSKIVITPELLLDFESSIGDYSKEKDICSRDLSSLAYVMYTSGSTGQPKGVLIEDRGIIRLVKKSNYINIEPSSVLLSTGSFSFDATTFEYWGMLLNGGTLILSEEDLFLSPIDLSSLIKAKGVTMMWFTSGLLNQLIDEAIDVFEGLTTVLSGGDRLSPVHIGKLRSRYPLMEIINGYGPTENTTFSTSYLVKEAVEGVHTIPIGTPISNSTAYILDAAMSLVPKGVVGELYLGGAGLSRGYLNREDLTEEKFIASPFITGQRLYRTGDLVKRNQNGEIEFIGRQDNQVKIRGYRIELGEIEHLLSTYPGVNAALVVVEESQGDKLLLGYITSEETIAESVLRDWLFQRLPSYMVPSYIHILERFPLTVNGKIDRTNLPGMTGVLVNSDSYIAPENETQKKLSELWMEILNVPQVGLSDNFFELGGHSLKATKLMSRIHKEFNVKLRLLEFFNHPDLQSQSALISSKTSVRYDSIPRLEQQDSYPLSLMQRRLWIMSQFEDANIAYNMSAVYVFKGHLELSLLEQSFQTLISRHEILRTYFKKDASGEIRQYIQPTASVDFSLGSVDARTFSETELSQALSKTLKTPFDLSQGPLLRVDLYQISEDRWIFSSVIHHIISDGWSLEVLIRELLILYNSLVTGESFSLPPLQIQYKDYASWQLNTLSDSSSDQAYWLNQFSGDLPVLDLSGGKIRPSIKTYNGGVYNSKLSKTLSTALAALLQKEEATLFMGLLSAVNALFYHYTSQEDIIIGSPIAGRDHRDLEDQIGFYVNTLALRTQFSKEDSFEELLSKVKTVVLDAHAHQLYPFDELVSGLGLQRDMSRNPLFDVQVIVQNKTSTETITSQELEGLSVTYYEGEVSHTSIFDLVFNFIESEDGIQISTIYNTDVFDYDWLVQIHNHLEVLLKEMLASSTTSLSQLSCLTKQEASHLLESFNALKIPYDSSTTIVNLIEEQVKKTPEAIAVYYEGIRLSYQELEDRSNQLAHYLIEECGVSGNDLIGIMMDRSELMFIGILGILKSGGAYVPIDPDYPESRKSYILKDTQVKVLLTQSDYIFDLSYYSGNLFAMDLQLLGLTNSKQAPSVSINANDLVYIIYTSGSTGNPKGVLVSHGNLIHSLAPRESVYGTINRFLLLSSIAFDSSVAGIFSTLSTGGQLCVTKGADISNVSFIADYIINEQISHLLTVPSYYRLLLNSLSEGGSSSLKEVTVAGEHCPISLITDHYASAIGQSGCSLFNEYGPTECTVWSSVHKYAAGEKVTSTIGKPIANSYIYILNKEDALVPIGVIGEICIGGAGVTKGYLNRPELTDEKFVADPFNAGGKMYKTGDLGRWNAKGEIEFLGRKDDQVKIRGYRIELGEIQYALETYESIESAVVLAKDNPSGDNELYVYLLGDEALNVSELKQYLGGLLPSYAIPSNYTQVPSFPRTPNGKIDTKALLSMEIEGLESGVAYIAPRTKEEEILVTVWQEILNKKNIGVKDRFFDLGGDSLKLIRLISLIDREFNVKLELKDIYEIQSLEDQVKAINEVKNSEVKNKDIANDLLTRLKELNVTVKVVNDKLDVKAPKGVINKELLNEIEVNKESLIELIEQYSASKITADKQIPIIEKRENYELSSSQRRVWVLSQMEDGNVTYNMPEVYVFKGELNLEVFNLAYQTLILRHESLRTNFREDENGEIKQFIKEQQDVNNKIAFKNLTENKEKANKVEQLIDKLCNYKFNLASDDLLKCTLLQVENNEWVFCYVIHHIISDGWSMDILTKELFILYNAFIKGEENPLTPLRIQYKEYASWQQKQLQGIDSEIYKNYWLKQFEGEVPVLNLLTDKKRPIIKTFNGGTINKQLSKTAIEALKEISAREGGTLYMSLLAIVNVLLYRYTNQNDIIIGSPVGGRTHSDLENQIGFYTNTLALRSQFKENDSYLELLKKVKETALGGLEHQIYPFDELVGQLDLQRDMSRNVLFDVFVALQNAVISSENRSFSGLQIENYNKTTVKVTKFDLTFNFNQSSDGLWLSLEYNSDLFYKETAERIALHFLQLTESIIAQPNKSISDLEYINDFEKEQLLNNFGAESSAYDEEQTIISLFEDQANKTPDAVALLFEEKEYTFKDLQEKSNQLGNYLRNKYKIQQEDLVGIKLERNEWIIIAMLGILKSGGAYMPLDPSYPQERIDYMLEDSSCKLLIDQEEILTFQNETHYYKEDAISFVNAPSDLAYVIYTSGSTGKPKGVMIEHKNVVAFLESCTSRFGLSNMKMPLLASNAFDIFLFESFYPMLTGGTVLMLSNEHIRDMYLLADSLKNVNAFHAVPALMSQILAHIKSTGEAEEYHGISDLFIGGDKVSSSVLKEMHEVFPRASIYELYGPTETTVFVTANHYSKKHSENNYNGALIGTPNKASYTQILDNKNKLCGIGIPGEICIGGNSVARGYLKREALTAENFIANPYKSEHDKIYKTGDYGKLLSNGVLEFIGRKDNQVKIKGHRIELGEIEHALNSLSFVKEAVVVVKAVSKNNDELVAYLISDEEVETKSLRNMLQKTLTVYMIPTYFIQLDAFPLTSNGKIDIKALPNPEHSDLKDQETYVSPTNEIEEIIVGVYQEVLRKEKIGIKDDFFTMGGDSIKSIQIVARLKQRNLSLTIQDILLNPIIEDLSRVVKKVDRTISQETVKDEVGLSPIQSYFFEKHPINHHHFNQSILLFNSEGIKEEGVRKVFDKIMQHHDALRMTYHKSESNVWLQKNNGEELKYDLERWNYNDLDSFHEKCEQLQSSININEGPLVKLGLFKGTAGDHLLIVIHHLVIDAVSWKILLEDLEILFNQYMLGDTLKLPLKTDSFIHWQKELQRYSKSSALEKEHAYWSSVNTIAIDKIPLDKKSGNNFVKNESTQSYSLNKELTEALLTKCNKAYGTTINEILLTSCVTAVKKAFDLQEVAVWMEAHGRENIDADIDISRTIGWFTSIYPVVFSLKEDKNILELISVKDTLRRVPNKGIGYGVLKYLASKEYTLNPEISFNYLGNSNDSIEIKEDAKLFEIMDKYKGNESSLAMEREQILDIKAIISDGCVNVDISYSQDLFYDETIEEIMKQSKINLIGLIEELSMEKEAYATPSDFTFKGLSMQELEQLNKI
ncbi:non-ribosomal peptide synthetase [uncultured Flavobacterium sp.]|uniref:non-ribosomal peptide synthetase n=1 Tax=uncultured Flavobacterium sp. TaxID=165435 RepID=UPI0025F7D213|nr:non-ribosomal peptide synthetase [uncultured Flavobacterium sp.]